MKSFEDELNDAIQKVLHDSFENFEKKPRASIDQKIYEALDKPSRIGPLMLFATAALLMLLLGFGVIKMVELDVALPPITHSESAPYTPKDTANAATHADNRAADAARPSHTENKSGMVLSDSGNAKQLKRVTHAKAPNTPHKPFRLASGKVKHHTHTVFAAEIPFAAIAPAETSRAENSLVSATDRVHGLSVQDQNNQVANVSPIPVDGLVSLPVDLVLPEIIDTAVNFDSTLQAAMPRSEKRKLDLPVYQPGEKKSFAWIFNANATNTFQSIYLLPNPESRILKVSFPVSTANLGYKFSAGFQTLGFQLLFNYSHISWKAEYVYAIDEFKADEDAANRYIFERLGKAETVTSKVGMAGIGIKKQLDFKSRQMGRFFAQFGVDYSRQMLTSGQNFIAGAISAGKVITVNRATDLIVGPYFEYNFKKVPTAEYRIKVRPNQVGLSVGLRINRTKLAKYRYQRSVSR